MSTKIHTSVETSSKNFHILAGSALVKIGPVMKLASGEIVSGPGGLTIRLDQTEEFITLLQDALAKLRYAESLLSKI